MEASIAPVEVSSDSIAGVVSNTESIASTSDRAVPAKTFSRFCELPVELQVKIWRLAAAGLNGKRSIYAIERPRSKWSRDMWPIRFGRRYEDYVIPRRDLPVDRFAQYPPEPNSSLKVLSVSTLDRAASIASICRLSEDALGLAPPNRLEQFTFGPHNVEGPAKPKFRVYMQPPVKKALARNSLLFVALRDFNIIFPPRHDRFALVGWDGPPPTTGLSLDPMRKLSELERGSIELRSFRFLFSLLRLRPKEIFIAIPGIHQRLSNDDGDNTNNTKNTKTIVREEKGRKTKKEKERQYRFETFEGNGVLFYEVPWRDIPNSVQGADDLRRFRGNGGVGSSQFFNVEPIDSITVFKLLSFEVPTVPSTSEDGPALPLP